MHAFVSLKAIEMSFDHKPEDEPEKERINKAGGKVTMDGRVNGGLNLSRAIGESFENSLLRSLHKQLLNDKMKCTASL